VLYSEADMTARGEAAYSQMRAEIAASEDARATRYVQCVADHVVEALPNAQRVRTRYAWEVTLFADEQANAFALPGGKMGVYEGLLDVAINQHQLAAVMAHEVGHVLANHSNERASQSALRNVGFGVAQILGVSDATLQAIDMGTQLGVFLPFNRTQESEADIVGLSLMAQAGFEPEESISLWENMAASGGGRQPELLSTHPSPASRMSDLRARIPAAEAELDAAQALGRFPDCIR
jgi:predicted Zn-dependent protease